MNYLSFENVVVLFAVSTKSSTKVSEEEVLGASREFSCMSNDCGALSGCMTYFAASTGASKVFWEWCALPHRGLKFLSMTREVFKGPGRRKDAGRKIEAGKLHDCDSGVCTAASFLRVCNSWVS